MATNKQQGGAMAMQGAQMGSQFGPWGALIGAGIGWDLGSTAPDNEKIMLDKYNAEVVKNAARDLFEMRRVQNEENKRTSQALVQFQDNRKVQTASINAQLGAADIVGASANALKQTLDLQTNEAMNQTMINAITGMENFNTKVDQMTNQRTLSLQRYRGQAPLDAGKLVSTGVDIYSQFNTQGQGASLMDSFKGMWGGMGGKQSSANVSGSMFNTGSGMGGGAGSNNAKAMFNMSVS